MIFAYLQCTVIMAVPKLHHVVHNALYAGHLSIKQINQATHSIEQLVLLILESYVGLLDG